MNNIDEFKSRVRPGARKSKLSHLLEDMQSLRDDGYTLSQIQDYLKSNGVTVTVPGLSSYLKRHATRPIANHPEKKEGKTEQQRRPLNKTADQIPTGFKYEGTLDEKDLF